MPVEGRLMEEIELTNGLVLFIYNHSLKLAGDRWRAQLLLRIPVDISKVPWEDCEGSQEALDAFRAFAGDTLFFEAVRVRNFIDESEMPRLLEEMKQECLRSSLPYFSHANFAVKYVQKCLRDWKQRQFSHAVQRTGVNEDLAGQ